MISIALQQPVTQARAKSATVVDFKLQQISSSPLQTAEPATNSNIQQQAKNTNSSSYSCNKLQAAAKATACSTAVLVY